LTRSRLQWQQVPYPRLKSFLIYPSSISSLSSTHPSLLSLVSWSSADISSSTSLSSSSIPPESSRKSASICMIVSSSGATSPTSSSSISISSSTSALFCRLPFVFFAHSRCRAAESSQPHEQLVDHGIVVAGIVAGNGEDLELQP